MKFLAASLLFLLSLTASANHHTEGDVLLERLNHVNGLSYILYKTYHHEMLYVTMTVWGSSADPVALCKVTDGLKYHKMYKIVSGNSSVKHFCD